MPTNAYANGQLAGDSADTTVPGRIYMTSAIALAPGLDLGLPPPFRTP